MYLFQLWMSIAIAPFTFALGFMSPNNKKGW